MIIEIKDIKDREFKLNINDIVIGCIVDTSNDIKMLLVMNHCIFGNVNNITVINPYSQIIQALIRKTHNFIEVFASKRMFISKITLVEKEYFIKYCK
jgi:hypothetical protein